MKKLNLIFGLLIGLLIFTNCSRDDDNSNNSDNLLNPPSWIHGKWILEDPQEITEIGFRFTSDDIISIQSSTIQTSHKGQLKMVTDAGQEVSVNEEITSTTYKATSNLPAGQTVIHSFTKISNSKIRWNSGPGIILTKQ